MEGSCEVVELVSREAASVANSLSLPVEFYCNDPDTEMAWAMRAKQHAKVFYKLISSVDSQFLKLMKVDDQIYFEFWEHFEKLKVDVLDLEELKSESAKEKWRPFCFKFGDIAEDYNYGTMLQLDCSQGYMEENTIFAPRIQFFAIEIAQNREGCNKAVYISIHDIGGRKGGSGGKKGADSGGVEEKRVDVEEKKKESPEEEKRKSDK